MQKLGKLSVIPVYKIPVRESALISLVKILPIKVAELLVIHVGLLTNGTK